MKYIFFDIDHTLVSHKNKSHIPDQTLLALKLLREAGHVTAIATGRAYFLTRLLADELKINTLVCAGGAEIILNGQKIFKSYLPANAIEKFNEAAEKFPDIVLATDGEYFYTSGAFNDAREYFKSQAGYECFKPLKKISSALICYMILPPEQVDDKHGMFKNPPEGVRLELMHGFVEARNENTSKWLGIKTLIEKLHADINDVITFGDGANDIEMIARAKIGVAVGKSKAVHEVADYIADDIDDGGILKACKDLGLI